MAARSIAATLPSLNIQKTYNGDVTSNDARFHRTSLTSGDFSGLEETQQFELTAVEQETAPPAGLRIVGEPIEFRAYSAGEFASVDLMPDGGDAPSVLKIDYGISQIDTQLVVRRWDATDGWLEAGCGDRLVEQMANDNLFIVPVCETGRYALFTPDASGPAIASVSTTHISVSKDGPSVTVTIQLSKPAVGNEKIDFTTANSTATAGADYVANSGTISFGTGETSQSVKIAIKKDELSEGAEQFGIVFSNPINTILGTNSVTTVTITDDDGAVQKMHTVFLPIVVR